MFKFEAASHIDEYLEAIKDRDEFVVKYDEAGGYKVINYLVNFEDTFPDPEKYDDPHQKRLMILRRDCRGIMFDSKTGKVISKRYHKFFNLNERPETQAHLIDFSQPHVILDKLDGSMITPLVFDDGSVRWCTKMGLTDVARPVEEFVKNHPTYEELARELAHTHMTPIFEWCSRQQRIVIDYPEDRLVLTAIRCNESGRYEPYDFLVEFAKNFEIEVVRALPGSVENLNVFLQEVRDLKGAEGFVIRFETGHMLKVKADEYCMIHRAIDHLRHEKDVLRMILDEKLDDVKALLPNDLGKTADRFGSDIFHNVHKVAENLYWQVREAHDRYNGSKKDFAVQYVNGGKIDKRLAGLAFSTWDRLEDGVPAVVKLVLDVLKNSCGTQTKVNDARHLMGGVVWAEYVSGVAIPEDDS